MGAAFTDKADHGAIVNLSLNVFYKAVGKTGAEGRIDIIHAHPQEKNIADKVFTAEMDPVVLLIGQFDIADKSEYGIVMIGQANF